jgi:endoglucanase
MKHPSMKCAILLFLGVAMPLLAQRRGVNLAGAEFGENTFPGTLGKEYTFNSEKSFQYFSAKSLGLLRVPVRWERLQPALRGPLNRDYLNLLKSNSAWALASGAQIVVDIHNFGRYKINGQELIIGNGQVSAADLADLWVKLSAEFRDDLGVYAYGLMNEPHDMGAGDWKSISQTVLSAIRATGDTKTILVPGDSWSSAEAWPRVHGTNAWINDPSGQFAYEAHTYFDSDNSGSYKMTYDQELGRNPLLAQVGVSRLSNFVDWCAANKVRGFLGEFGVPNTDPRWLSVLDNFLTSLDLSGMDSLYWAAGEWWGSYPLSVQPANAFTQDRPQLGVLMSHLSPSAFTTVAAPTFNGWIFAPDSLVSGFGKGMPPDAVVLLTDSAGIKRQAKILYRSASQINYAIPPETALGKVVVEAGTASGVFWLERSAPALFESAQIVRVKSGGGVSYETTTVPIAPAGPGETLYLVMYGTGFRNAPNIGLQVAGRVTPLLYAGPQPEFPGLDQINVQLPGGLLGYVSVSLSADGKASNTLTLRFQ